MDIEEELVEKAKLGDDEAFSKLYESIYVDMYKYAYYMLGNVHDAEDVISDTVIDIYAGITKLRNNNLFRQWSFKILSNKCKKKRKQYLSKNVSLDNENVQYDKVEQQDIELKYDLEQAFKILSEEERTVVFLAIFGGYRSKEIGDILDIKATTARSKLSRALDKMQRKLELQF